jgi:CubicO group peptidase (beta-lactamase class C family)
MVRPAATAHSLESRAGPSQFATSGRRNAYRRAVLALASLVSLAGCGDSTSVAPKQLPVDLSQPWLVATPASQDVDSAALAAAYARGESTVGLRSLIVVRNGHLIGERYYGAVTADSLNDVRSVTKSVTSLLVGIAIARGLITGTSERLGTLVHPPVALVEGAKADITVDNLLTMTSGFDWDESTAAGYNAWALASDQIQYLLDRPLSDPPGTRFNYNSGAVHLLAVGLSEAAGTSEQVFAEQYLFTALGIRAHAWEMDSRGFNNGAAGLSLRARDLAKLGQLVLQGGASGADQVVPADWIQRVLAVHERPDWRYGPVADLAYGYLWWLATVAGRDVAFAWGYRGQFLVLVPELQLVVVATASLDAPVPADVEGQAVLDLIINSVITAVHP